MPMPQEMRPIIIPTGNFDQNRVKHSGLRTSQSASLLYAGPRRGYTARHSISNMEGYTTKADRLKETLESLSLSTNGDTDSGLDSQEPSARSHGRARLKNITSFEASSDSSYDGVPPSAVNLKTGASIFSLDVSPKSSSSLGLGKKRGKGPRPLNSEGSRGSCLPSKEKLSKSRSKAEDWFNSDSLSQAQTTRAGGVQSHYFDNSDEEGPPEANEDNCDGMYGSPEIYLEIATQTKNAGCFNKLAYPDMHGHIPPPYREPLHEKKFGIQR